jgi:hypothetical protein
MPGNKISFRGVIPVVAQLREFVTVPDPWLQTPGFDTRDF